MRPALAACALLLAATVCACEPAIDRPGTWQPTGANEHNLRAMVADPRDLQAGAGVATERGSGASRAVTRLLIDRRRPLLNASLSRVAPGQDTPADTPLPSAATGAPAGAAPAQ